jgi:hypothetical protein
MEKIFDFVPALLGFSKYKYLVKCAGGPGSVAAHKN